MSQAAANPNPMIEAPFLDSPIPKLRLVEPPEVDERKELWAFQCRCEAIARELATASLAKRLEAYGGDGYSYRELSTAAALCPELMPTINGEWEWIALTMADNE